MELCHTQLGPPDASTIRQQEAGSMQSTGRFFCGPDFLETIANSCSVQSPGNFKGTGIQVHVSHEYIKSQLLTALFIVRSLLVFPIDHPASLEEGTVTFISLLKPVRIQIMKNQNHRPTAWLASEARNAHFHYRTGSFSQQSGTKTFLPACLKFRSKYEAAKQMHTLFPEMQGRVQHVPNSVGVLGDLKLDCTSEFHLHYPSPAAVPDLQDCFCIQKHQSQVPSATT